MRAGLASLPKALQAHGYVTGAIVANWTLRHKLTGLGEHFESYDELLTRKRWFGLVNGEANGKDVTEAAIDWIDDRLTVPAGRPYFLWVHYSDPHAPYIAHHEFRERLGLEATGDLTREERYDTEVAFVDAAIGRLVEHLARRARSADTLIVFGADHGESLGEHGYWGHGRNLYEPGLRIPLAVVWPARVRPQVVPAPAVILDIAPTILGLAGFPSPTSFRGYHWGDVLQGGPAPTDRLTRYQAHKGAVLSVRDSELARRSGLLEVGVIRGTVKEIFHVREQRRERYDLAVDPTETRSLDAPKTAPSEGVLAWMRAVYSGLAELDDRTPEPLDEESSARLRSLGYVD
jgi:arylsulfatase A-like enzyme